MIALINIKNTINHMLDLMQISNDIWEYVYFLETFPGYSENVTKKYSLANIQRMLWERHVFEKYIWDIRRMS
jgi:hypothetical protein